MLEKLRTKLDSKHKLQQELGSLCVIALKRAFAHPHIRVDEAGTFDDLFIDELHKAAKRRYADEKTFRALARLCYMALITEGLKDEKLKYWYGGVSEKKKFEPWQLECTCEHFGDDHDGLGPCDNCQCQKFREKSKC